MSPTLKKNPLDLLFLRSNRFLDIGGKLTLVPVGLHVGGETDHTVLLEVTAEGILSFWLAIISNSNIAPQKSALVIDRGLEKSKVSTGNFVNVPECRRADRTSEA